MPAPDRDWAFTDYQTAASVLGTIAATDPKQLPRWRSKTSGAMFGRLSADQNLDILRDKKLPIQSRTTGALAVLNAANQILKIYLNASLRGKSYDAEMIEMSIFSMKVVQAIFPVMREFLASLPEAEAKAPVRQQGLQKMRNGFAEMVNGFLLTFTEKQTYRTEHLVRLGREMKTVLPSILIELPPLTQQEIPIRLQKLVDNESDPELKQVLIDLRDALRTP
jgi:hypothetical protein